MVAGDTGLRTMRKVNQNWIIWGHGDNRIAEQIFRDLEIGA